MGKKHSIINYCYKTDCKACQSNYNNYTGKNWQRFGTCHYSEYFNNLFKKIRELKEKYDPIGQLPIEEFRQKLRHQLKSVSADRLALKGGANPPGILIKSTERR